MTENIIRYNAWYSGEKLGVFDKLNEAQQVIKNHDNYKKSLFTNKGKPTSRNKDHDNYFAIYDTNGYGWTL